MDIWSSFSFSMGFRSNYEKIASINSRNGNFGAKERHDILTDKMWKLFTDTDHENRLKCLCIPVKDNVYASKNNEDNIIRRITERSMLEDEYKASYFGIEPNNQVQVKKNNEALEKEKEKKYKRVVEKIITLGFKEDMIEDILFLKTSFGASLNKIKTLLSEGFPLLVVGYIYRIRNESPSNHKGQIPSLSHISKLFLSENSGDNFVGSDFEELTEKVTEKLDFENLFLKSNR